MKAILEFDLDDYHDQLAHNRALTATKAYLAIYDIENLLRNELKSQKYENNPIRTKLESIQEEIVYILENNKIDMDNLE